MHFFIIKDIEKHKESFQIFKSLDYLNINVSKQVIKMSYKDVFLMDLTFKSDAFDTTGEASCLVNTKMFLLMLKAIKHNVFGIEKQLICFSHTDIGEILLEKISSKYNTDEANKEFKTTEEKIYDELPNSLTASFLEHSFIHNDNFTDPLILEFTVNKDLLHYFYADKTKYIFDKHLYLINTTHQHDEQTKIQIEYIKPGKHEFICYNAWVKQLYGVKSLLDMVVFKVYENHMVVNCTFKDSDMMYASITVEFTV